MKKKLNITIKADYEKDETGTGWSIIDVNTNQDVDDDIIATILEEVVVSYYIDNDISYKSLKHNIKQKYKNIRTLNAEYEKVLKRYEESKK